MTNDSLYPLPNDPYEIVDAVLIPWANHHKVHIATRYRDDFVRSIWVYEELGNPRAQIWLDRPISTEQVAVRMAELDLNSPTKWGRREHRSVPLSDLESAIEELRVIAFAWAGPGAYA